MGYTERRMPIQETSLGGPLGAFPDTSWGDLVRLRQADGPIAREILGRLVASYWRPLYLAIRRGWGKSVEDAKDLTQEFVSRIMTGDVAETVDPSRGRFRDWLKAALRHFLLQAKRDASAIKRGGDILVLPLDAVGEADAAGGQGRGGDPAGILDHEWAKEVLQRSIDQLRAQMILDQKGLSFEIFQKHDMDPPDGRRPSYRELADAFGLPVVAIRDHLVAARSALREMVRKEIARYAGGPEEVQEEIRLLLGGE